MPSQPTPTTFSTRRRGGFTLIELLIVVAIIAILAAIAVPNFLEAQTRSKVSRAKADMRSIATALESYAVDNNHYPASYFQPEIILNPRNRRLIPLTTPIAYMTTVPLDVFNQEEPNVSSYEEVRAFIYTDRRSYGEWVTNAFSEPPNMVSGQTRNLYRNLWGVQFQSSPWLLRSRGPLGTGSIADGSNLGNNADITSFWDPTNGTMSVGNIFMLGGAGFPGQE